VRVRGRKFLSNFCPIDLLNAVIGSYVVPLSASHVIKNAVKVLFVQK
jgi:hypothetical protein